jgi:hypothetical protein
MVRLRHWLPTVKTSTLLTFIGLTFIVTPLENSSIARFEGRRDRLERSDRSVLGEAWVADGQVWTRSGSFASLRLELLHAVKLAFFRQNIHPFGQGFDARLDHFDWDSEACPRQKTFGGAFHVIDFPHDTPVRHPLQVQSNMPLMDLNVLSLSTESQKALKIK